MHRRPLLGDRVYARAVQEGHRVWLQYWLFYYFNDKSLAGIGAHEGDWEMIQIGLDRGGHPELATFAQHKGGERRPWKQVETLDDEPDAPPVVYVALGSHAAYFQTGNYWLRPLPLSDHAVDGPQVRPAVERLDGIRWVDWLGHWGSGGAPQGPKQHRQFAAPHSWHSGSAVHVRRRVRIGRTFLVERDAELPPPVKLDAALSGDTVSVTWEVAELNPLDPRVPVRILLSVRRADPLPDKRLDGLVCFTRESQRHAVADASELLSGLQPEAADAPTLVASARLAFDRDPARYVKKGADRLLQNQIKCMQGVGVRAGPPSRDEGEKPEPVESRRDEKAETLMFELVRASIAKRGSR